MQSKTPRLQFSEEALESPNVAKAAKKAGKAADKADAAKEKLSQGSKLRHDADKARERQEQLRFGKKDTSEPAAASRKRAQKPSSGLRQNVPGQSHQQAGKSPMPHIRFDGTSRTITPPGSRVPHTAVSVLSGSVHREIRQNEEENVGVQAAHQSEELVEGTTQAVAHARYSKKLKAYNKASKLERKADHANVDTLYQQRKADDPSSFSNPASRWQQKQHIRKEYAAAKRTAYRQGKSTGAATDTIRTKAENAISSIRKFFSQRQHGKELLCHFQKTFYGAQPLLLTKSRGPQPRMAGKAVFGIPMRPVIHPMMKPAKMPVTITIVSGKMLL